MSEFKCYVGNLSFDATEEGLAELFGQYGEAKARIITDRETRRSRGFAFVTLPDSDSGKKAIDALNDQEYLGRKLRVNEAQERS